MPLAFPSLTHGTIAFGFFNIDTDLLLLEHYFFFADDFSRHICRIAAGGGEENPETTWEAFTIENRAEIGDLMGAIHGIRFSGFIGEVYRRFPFPQREDQFKQKPEGHQNRSLMEGILEGYARKGSIPFKAEKGHGTVLIGEYLFTPHTFRGLLDYVWVGGYPRWKDGVRPDYVMSMKKAVEESTSWLFDGLVFS
jgi:hypothetical protein